MSSIHPLLQVRALTRTFGRLRAVNQVSFEISAGSCVGLIRANGAGKTTLMRMLSTLDTPDGGCFYYKGINALEKPEEVRAHIGWMPDAMDMWPHTTVSDYLDFVAQVNGYTGENRKQAVSYWAKFSGIAPLLSRKIDKLSKGESQRLALARMLIGDPEFLILDEPAAGLDPQARHEFKSLVRQLQAQGRTLLISSHILSELAEMCDSIIMMDAGKIIAAGNSAELLGQVQATQAPRYRFTPAGDSTALAAALQTSPTWSDISQTGKQVEANYQGDTTALPQALAELMQAHSLLECHLLQLNWEEGFVALLSKKTR
ncbi:MAG: ABC transporter ATP-binding protein [Akkermansia sp.]